MKPSLPLVVRLSLGHWRLFGAVGIGVLLATTIMAAGVIYFDSLQDLGLRRQLSEVSAESLDLEIHAGGVPATRNRHNATVGNVLLGVERNIGWFTGETQWAVRSSAFRFPPTAEQVQLAESRGDDPVGSSAVFALFPEIDARINIVSGRSPAPAPAPGPGESPAPVTIEVMVSRADAIEFGLTVGASHELSPTWSSETPNPKMVVTGIYERSDPDDLFWRVPDDVLGFGVEARAAPAVLVTPGDSYLGVLGPLFPNLSSSYGFLVPVNTDSLNSRNADRALADMELLLREGRGAVQNFRMSTDLDRVILEFDLKAFFNRAPMTIVGILVLLLVLYYAVTLASLLVDAQRDEFSLLRTRGAGSLQISSVYGVEAGLIAIIAVVAGPPLAALVVYFAGFLPGVHGLNGGSGLPVAVTASAYQLAAVGGALSFGAMLVPALRASRVGLLVRRRGIARGGGPSFFRRYYLDLVLLAMAVLLFRQLQSQGSFVGETLFGDAVIDNVTLAAPALLLLVAGLVLLRLFPLSMELLARALERGDDPATAVGRVFETIGLAKTSGSAHEARSLGFLRPEDSIVPNKDHLLYQAKQRALALAADGYGPPPTARLPVVGAELRKVLIETVEGMVSAGQATDHDLTIARELAYVLTGGDRPAGSEADEEHFLELEREALVKLCHEAKSQERLDHIMQTGRPLRN